MSNDALFLANVFAIDPLARHVFAGLAVSLFTLYICHHLARLRKKSGVYDFSGFVCIVGIMAAIVYWWLEQAYVRAGVTTLGLLIGIVWIIVSELRLKQDYIRLK